MPFRVPGFLKDLRRDRKGISLGLELCHFHTTWWRLSTCAVALLSARILIYILRPTYGRHNLSPRQHVVAIERVGELCRPRAKARSLNASLPSRPLRSTVGTFYPSTSRLLYTFARDLLYIPPLGTLPGITRVEVVIFRPLSSKARERGGGLCF